MLGSMYSAVSGLAAHQTKMNVIGNNIANVNTYGFKASRVTFSDVFYQTLKPAASSTTISGGTNAVQLGHGASINSIDVLHTTSGSATTSRPLDLYIDGDGYFAVQDENGDIKYTRLGILSFDPSGHLIDSSGNYILGIPMDSSGKNKTDSKGTLDVDDLAPINIKIEELNMYSNIAIGENGEITAIKDGESLLLRTATDDWLVDASVSANAAYYGPISMTAVRKSVAFKSSTYDGTNGTPEIKGVTVDSKADINGKVSMKYDSVADEYSLSYTNQAGEAKLIKGTLDPATQTLSFDVPSLDGKTAPVKAVLDGADPAKGIVWPAGAEELELGTVAASAMDITVSTLNKRGTVSTITGTWSGGDKITVGGLTLKIDPEKFAALGNADLSEKTIGTGVQGPSSSVKIANIGVVKFVNPDGLLQDGDGYYLESGNSGEPVGVVPGQDGAGSLVSGSLEMSNVDLAKEFTEMIITQRGFQANTRMITVSDEMLSELVSMKR